MTSVFVLFSNFILHFGWYEIYSFFSVALDIIICPPLVARGGGCEALGGDKGDKRNKKDKIPHPPLQQKLHKYVYFAHSRRVINNIWYNLFTKI